MADDHINQSVEVLADLLEKLVDVQVVQSEKLSVLKELTRSSAVDIDGIRAQFSNGFKSEIKKHVSEETQTMLDKMVSLESKVSEVDNKLEGFQKPGFWAKIIVSFLVAVGTIAVAAVRIADVTKTNQSSVIEKKIEGEEHAANTSGNSFKGSVSRP